MSDWRTIDWSQVAPTPTPAPIRPISRPRTSVPGGAYAPDNFKNAPRAALNATAQRAQDRRLPKSGLGARVPIPFGIGEYPGLYVRHWIDSVPNALWMLYVWCVGPVTEIVDIYTGDPSADDFKKPKIRNYLGYPSTNVADATIAALDGTYTDTLVREYSNMNVGLCYSLLRYDEDTPWSSPIAHIKGLKVYNPASDTFEFSEDPAYILAHWWTTPYPIGLGLSINWDSVEDVAAINQVMLGGFERRKIGQVIDKAASNGNWRDTLETYAGARMIERGGEWIMRSEHEATAVASLSRDDGDFRDEPLVFRRRTNLDTPNTVDIIYTDRTGDLWSDRALSDDGLQAELPEVISGAVEPRIKQVPLRGIFSASQARREAIRILHYETLQDLETVLPLHHSGMFFEVHDIINVTDSNHGMTAKPFKAVTGPRLTPHGVDLPVIEFDPAVNSDEVVSTPTYPDFEGISASLPPMLVALSAEEERYRRDTGELSTRLIINWQLPVYPYSRDVDLKIYVDNKEIQVLRERASALQAKSVDLLRALAPESDTIGTTRSALIVGKIISTLGQHGPTIGAVVYIEADLARPPDVTGLTGRELGGIVLLNWDDVEDIGPAVTYRVRRAAIDGGWLTATPIKVVGSSQVSLFDQPEGTFDYMVRAVDSGGRESASAARVRVVITIDEFGDANNVQTPFKHNRDESNIYVTRLDHNSLRVVEMDNSVPSNTIPDDGYYRVIGIDKANPANQWQNVWQKMQGSPDIPLYRHIVGVPNDEIKTKTTLLPENISREISWTFPVDTDGNVYLVSIDTTSGIEWEYDGQDGKETISGDQFYISIKDYTYCHYLIGDGKHFAEVQRITYTETGVGHGQGTASVTLQRDYSVATMCIVQSLTPGVTAYPDLGTGNDGTVDNSKVAQGFFDIVFLDNAGNPAYANFSYQFEGYFALPAGRQRLG